MWKQCASVKLVTYRDEPTGSYYLDLQLQPASQSFTVSLNDPVAGWSVGFISSSVWHKMTDTHSVYNWVDKKNYYETESYQVAKHWCDCWMSK